MYVRISSIELKKNLINGAKLKYAGKTVTNQNYIFEENNSRVRSEMFETADHNQNYMDRDVELMGELKEVHKDVLME